CFIGKLGGWGRGILPNQKVFFRVSLAAFMAENRLLAVPIRWRNPIKRPSSAVRVGKAFDERRVKKMPSSAALEALPQIFRAAVEPVDVITASVAAALLAAPDRIGEVLRIPR
ncbi:hypothetical protein ACT03L_34010, partial [Pseudomonas aeruginosa]